MRAARITIDITAPDAPDDLSKMKLLLLADMWDGERKIMELDYERETSRYGFAYLTQTSLDGIIGAMDNLLLSQDPPAIPTAKLSREVVNPFLPPPPSPQAKAMSAVFPKKGKSAAGLSGTPVSPGKADKKSAAKPAAKKAKR